MQRFSGIEVGELLRCVDHLKEILKVDSCQTQDIKDQIQENITFPVPESGSNEQNQ